MFRNNPTRQYGRRKSSIYNDGLSIEKKMDTFLDRETRDILHSPLQNVSNLPVPSTFASPQDDLKSKRKVPPFKEPSSPSVAKSTKLFSPTVSSYYELSPILKVIARQNVMFCYRS